MTQKKKYSSTGEDMERKLARVMERLGVEKYDYDWAQRRGGAECYVEMVYRGAAYRFENSAAKSAANGRGLVYASDLFASVVYALEGLARAVEQDIFTLDMLLKGVPSLPAGKPLEPCFQRMGFTERPESVDVVKAKYRMLAKVYHPDACGDPEAFRLLTEDYKACLGLMEAIV